MLKVETKQFPENRSAVITASAFEPLLPHWAAAMGSVLGSTTWWMNSVRDRHSLSKYAYWSVVVFEKKQSRSDAQCFIGMLVLDRDPGIPLLYIASFVKSCLTNTFPRHNACNLYSTCVIERDLSNLDKVPHLLSHPFTCILQTPEPMASL
jgi:hypothetical protein